MPAKRLLTLVLILGAPLLLSCGDTTENTIIQGIDCGLVRNDLIGDWTVDLGTGSLSLQNCTGLDPGLNSTAVSPSGFPATYAGVDVFGSDGSTSFKIQADRTDGGNDATQDPELTGSVQADSCLAIVRVWDSGDALFYQCIGTLQRSSLTISGSCDSAEIDSDVDGQLDTSCSLSARVDFDASVN